MVAMKKEDIGVIKKIINFKQAVAEGDIEKRRKAEEELREVFEELGLGEKLTEYLIAHIKRAVEIEKAYEEKSKLMQEVRETIRELARKV
jgi:alcohol dehydrogenase YqhD (iron-dependent ADH family)